MKLTTTIQATEKRRNNVKEMLKELPEDTIVYYDHELKGPLNSFTKMLDIEVGDYRMHLQDDVILNKNLKDYLPYVLKDMKDNNWEALSLYAPTRKLIKEQIKKGLKYGVFPSCWIQCIIFSKRVLNLLREHRKNYNPTQLTRSDDTFINSCFAKNKIKVMVHLPSVVQHNVYLGSLIGHTASVKRMSDVYEKDYTTNFLKNKK
tara:strand:- start:68 stop:679 length:612 start_codon:yes stop_codon:yes gene_type:complete